MQPCYSATGLYMPDIMVVLWEDRSIYAMAQWLYMGLSWSLCSPSTRHISVCVKHNKKEGLL